MLSEKTKELVSKHLVKLGLIPNVEPIPQVIKLEELKTVDGAMLSVEKLEVGAKATFTGVDGISVEANGEYTLENGVKVVCEAGLIKEVVEPVQEPLESDTQESMLSKLSERLDVMEQSINKVFEEKKSLEAQLSVALSAIDELDKAAVSINLESQKVEKKEIDFSKLSSYEKYQLMKYGKVD